MSDITLIKELKHNGVTSRYHHVEVPDVEIKDAGNNQQFTRLMLIFTPYGKLASNDTVEFLNRSLETDDDIQFIYDNGDGAMYLHDNNTIRLYVPLDQPVPEFYHDKLLNDQYLYRYPMHYLNTTNWYRLVNYIPGESIIFEQIDYIPSHEQPYVDFVADAVDLVME